MRNGYNPAVTSHRPFFATLPALAELPKHRLVSRLIGAAR